MPQEGQNDVPENAQPAKDAAKSGNKDEIMTSDERKVEVTWKMGEDSKVRG